MTDSYRFPSRDEKLLGQELIGKKITIFWDGDNVFYPCTVTGFDGSNGKFTVEYEENSSGEKYTEDLKSSSWKIWAGTDEEYAAEREIKVLPTFCNTVAQNTTMIASLSVLVVASPIVNSYG